MQCVVPGLRERPPDRRVRHHAFVDPSGGSHRQLHALHRPQRHRPPHRDPRLHPRNQGAVLAQRRWCPSSAAVLKSYNVLSMSGDHYAKEWPVESFRRHGIRYTQDAQPKSDLYAGSLLPLINSRRIELFDLPVADRANLQPGAIHAPRRCRADRPPAPRPRRRRQRGCRSGGDMHAHCRLRFEPPRSLRRRSGRPSSATHPRPAGARRVDGACQCTGVDQSDRT